MLKRARAWLANVPVQDQVDRGNAYFMQIYFLFFGLMQPLNKLYMLSHANLQMVMYSHSHVLKGTSVSFFVDLATDAALSASAWIGFYLIRRGLFRVAIRQFLAVIIASVVTYFGVTGMIGVSADSILFVAMIIAALTLGRRALWWVFAGILFAYLAGMTAEALSPPPLPRYVEGLYAAFPGMVYAHLMVAFVLDRSVQSLRSSYDKVKDQHERLQRETVERELAQEQVLHSQKMDAVGRLASGIAHDIHNVLGVILGFARARQRLEEPYEDIAPIARELADALEGSELAARRGASACRKLLNFSRRSVTLPETFDAGAALHDMRPMLQQLLPPSVHLDVNTPEHALPILFDRNQFELALLNLVTNARDAMPNGGRCVVGASADSEDRVEISIRDNGTGIPEATRQRIFEPFFTTKPLGLGTGLGLSVVRDLVHRSGGTIVIDSALAVGTCVRMGLPKAPPPAPSAPLPQPPSVHVWLIDDDDDLRTLLRTALEQGGCVVDESANGVEAMQQLAARERAPEVLVCDQRMPDMDGSTLLMHIRERYPAVPAILISACMETDHVPDPAVHALSTRLPKPFAPDTLLGRVHDVAQQHPSQRSVAGAQCDTST